jgi:hypothetical protein
MDALDAAAVVTREADDSEGLADGAFGLQPGMGAAGAIRRIDPLRDDAFEL